MIKIDKAELFMMIKNFWAVDNNPVCLTATIQFLKQVGLTEKELSFFIDYDSWNEEDYRITPEDKANYEEKLEEAKEQFEEYFE